MEPNDPGLEIAKAAAEGAAREGVGKLAAFFGGFFPNFGVTKTAIDAYIDEVKSSNLSPDAKMRAILDAPLKARHYKNQAKIANLALSAAKEGTDFSSNSKVDDDWLDRFIDASKFVSDEEVQLLWGNVLAGEFESPGSTPPSVIRILSELTQKYANIFSSLCSLSISCMFDDGKSIINAGDWLLINNDTKSSYLKDMGITFSALEELERIGLINLSSHTYINQISNKEYPKIHLVACSVAIATVIKYNDRSFPLGHVTLTEAGKCISRLVVKQYHPDHVTEVKLFLKKHGAICSEFPEIVITSTTESEQGIQYGYKRITEP